MQVLKQPWASCFALRIPVLYRGGGGECRRPGRRLIASDLIEKPQAVVRRYPLSVGRIVSSPSCWVVLLWTGVHERRLRVRGSDARAR